jgi:hypothetical protein
VGLSNDMSKTKRGSSLGWPSGLLVFCLMMNASLTSSRMATDLNLHRKTAVSFNDTSEGRARDREVHIREKTWLLCFCLDRSLSAQMGKPHSIKEE